MDAMKWRGDVCFAVLSIAVLVPSMGVTQQRTKRSGSKTSRSNSTRVHFPSWSELKASSVRVQRGKLLVGLADGGAAVYEATSTTPLNILTGKGTGPVKELVWEGNQLWWISGHDVYAASISQKEPSLIQTGLSNPLRLSLWQGKVLVHGESDLRVLDPVTKQSQTPSEFFPKTIADQVIQGNLISNWHTTAQGAGEGQLVLIRRYGHKATTPEGQRGDLALFSGWQSTGRDYRFLGNYVRPLVDFHDVRGAPRVRTQVGPRRIDQPFGACDPSNLALGPEGFIAMDSSKVLAVPFRTSNWLPDEINVKVSADYSGQVAFSGDNVYWTRGNRLICASIEDGATDVYLPTANTSPIESVAADDNGAWFVSGGRVRHAVGDQSIDGYIRYAAGEPGGNDKLLRDAVLSHDRGDGLQAISDVLKSSGWEGKADLTDATLGKTPKVSTVLEVGDVIVRNHRSELYIGNGEVATWTAGLRHTEPLAIDAQTQAHRVLNRAALSAAAFRAAKHGAVDVDPASRGGGGIVANRAIFMGLGKPNPELGHDLFVSINIGGPYDRPWLPIHQKLLEEAQSWIGTKYAWGGNSKGVGTDCSGFVSTVFHNIGVNIPRQSQDIGQAAAGEVVTGDLRFGDVIVIPRNANGIGHVVLYVGNGQTLETQSHTGVSYGSISRRSSVIVRRFLLP